MSRILILLFAIAMVALSCFAAPTNTRAKAVLSARDIPDPNTVVKLAQSGLRNMMVVAKLTADNELNLLQPKKKPASPASSDDSGFGVSANPSAGSQKDLNDGQAAVAA